MVCTREQTHEAEEVWGLIQALTLPGIQPTDQPWTTYPAHRAKRLSTIDVRGACYGPDIAMDTPFWAVLSTANPQYSKVLCHLSKIIYNEIMILFLKLHLKLINTPQQVFSVFFPKPVGGNCPALLKCPYTCTYRNDFAWLFIEEALIIHCLSPLVY